MCIYNFDLQIPNDGGKLIFDYFIKTFLNTRYLRKSQNNSIAKSYLRTRSNVQNLMLIQIPTHVVVLFILVYVIDE